MGKRRGDVPRRRGAGIAVLAALAGAVGVVRKSKLDAADATLPEASSRVG